jgi:hypothetical protein
MHKQLLNVLVALSVFSLCIWIAPLIGALWNGLVVGQEVLTGNGVPQTALLDLHHLRLRWTELLVVLHHDLTIVATAVTVVAIWLGRRKEAAADEAAAANEAADEAAANEAAASDMVDPLGGLDRPVDLVVGQIRGPGPDASTITDGATLIAAPQGQGLLVLDAEGATWVPVDDAGLGAVRRRSRG